MYEIDQSAATQRKCIQKLDHKVTVNYITRWFFLSLTNIKNIFKQVSVLHQIILKQIILLCYNILGEVNAAKFIETKRLKQPCQS